MTEKGDRRKTFCQWLGERDANRGRYHFSPMTRKRHLMRLLYGEMGGSFVDCLVALFLIRQFCRLTHAEFGDHSFICKVLPFIYDSQEALPAGENIEMRWKRKQALHTKKWAYTHTSVHEPSDIHNTGRPNTTNNSMKNSLNKHCVTFMS